MIFVLISVAYLIVSTVTSLELKDSQVFTSFQLQSLHWVSTYICSKICFKLAVLQPQVEVVEIQSVKLYSSRFLVCCKSAKTCYFYNHKLPISCFCFCSFQSGMESFLSGWALTKMVFSSLLWKFLKIFQTETAL